MDFALVALVILALNLVALTFIGWRLRAPVQVHIHQPPMTVQSPPAILPPELLELMQALDAKLQPPPLPQMDVSEVTRLVEEGVAIAERTKGFKGPDKFRSARAHVQEQAKARGLAVDDRALALSIEAAALALRHPKKV